MLKWTRTNVEVPFLNGTRKEIRHSVTMPNGSEWSLRKADDIFFLYVNGEQFKGRLFFNTLKAGKATVQECADKMNGK